MFYPSPVPAANPAGFFTCPTQLLDLTYLLQALIFVINFITNKYYMETQTVDSIIAQIKIERDNLLGKIQDMSLDDQLTFMNAYAEGLNQRSRNIYQRALFTGKITVEDKIHLAETSIKISAAYELLSVLFYLESIKPETEEKKPADEEAKK